MSLRLLSIGLALLLCSACRSNLPSPGGESLRCGDGGACGEGLRCIEGVCVFNRAPVLEPLPVKIVAPGVPFTLEAIATDPDNATVEGIDTLTYSWVQVNGPQGASDWLPTPIADNPIFDTLFEEGTYILELTVTDGFDTVGPVQVTVLVGNTPPTVAPFLALTVQPGSEISVQARVTDLDDQPTTVRWTQTGGASVGLSDPYESDLLTATVGGSDVYTFEAVANDGFVDGPAEVLTVFVPPPGGALFVSDAAPANPNCGDIVAPCPTVSAALVSARNQGVSSIFVAAPLRGEYVECLNLQGDELVRGGFNPVGFGSDPQLRETTVISCDQSEGHQFGGTTSVQDLTLRSAVDVPAGMERVQVAEVVSGSVTLTDVNLLLADCGAGCQIAGLVASGGDVVLMRPNVSAQGSGFGSVQSFAGIGGLPGTTVEVYGDSSAPRAAGDGLRGNVVFNVAVSAFASGVGGFDANLIVEDFAVLGGLGMQLFGIRQYGGTGTFRRNVIDIEAVGALIADGILSQPCTDLYPECECVPSCSPTANPLTTAEFNTVRLGSVVGGSGPAPCRALGVGVSSTLGAQAIMANSVAVEGPFSFAAGIVADGPFGTDAGSVTANTIDIAGGRAELACFVIPREVLPTAIDGMSGIDVTGDGWTVSRNDVVAGGHDRLAAGLFLRDVSGFVGADNTFDTGRLDRGGSRGTLTGGALVLPSSQPTPAESTLERNHFLVGGQAIATVGVGIATTDPWTVANNFIYGGDAIHATGLAVELPPDGSSWPILLHNTIHGGGQLGQSLSTRAIGLEIGGDAEGVVATPTGTFLNNLLDAGSGTGRRYAVYNLGDGTFSEAIDNLAQIRSGVGGPMPGLIIPPVYDIFGNPMDIFSVVAVGSGEVMGFEISYPDVEEGQPTFMDGAPNFSWFADTESGRRLLLGFDDRVGLSVVNASGVANPTYFSTVDSLGVPRVPLAGVVGRVDELAPDDIAFLEDGGVGPNTAWAMTAEALGLTFSRPQQLAGLADPQHVVSIEGTVFFFDYRGSTVILQSLPSGLEFDVTSFVPDPLVSVQAVKIGEEFFPYANGRPDLVLIGDDEIRVVFNPVFDPMGGLPTSYTFAPCATSAPVDVRGGRATSPALAQPTLLVRCQNGDIETWSTCATINCGFTPEASTPMAAVDGWDWVNLPSNEDLLVVSRRSPARLTAYTMVAGGPFNEGNTRVLEAETAQLTPAGSSPTLSLTGFSLLGTECPLVTNSASHPPGGPANRDLHLENSTNPCADGGQLPVMGARTDDIDGLGTRDPGSDATPAVGADEP